MESVMLAFKRRDTKNVALQLGYTFSHKENLLDNGAFVTCHSCETIITKNNLGVITPGSKIAFCDNPVCYAKYLAGEGQI
jgi:hypothetical protein